MCQIPDNGRLSAFGWTKSIQFLEAERAGSSAWHRRPIAGWAADWKANWSQIYQ